MEKKNWQKQLLYITKILIESLESKKIAAVTSLWEDNAAYISIFFDSDPSDDELEDASIICTEIIAQMPAESLLNEQYITLKKNDHLPTDHLAYKRD